MTKWREFFFLVWLRRKVREWKKVDYKNFLIYSYFLKKNHIKKRKQPTNQPKNKKSSHHSCQVKKIKANHQKKKRKEKKRQTINKNKSSCLVQKQINKTKQSTQRKKRGK